MGGDDSQLGSGFGGVLDGGDGILNDLILI